MTFESNIQQHWYGAPGWLRVLLPLEIIYRLMTWLRRFLFRVGILRSEKIAVPVIVVGNITVGGTGKTPVVVALCLALKKAGHRPGVISRGYGAEPPQLPFEVTSQSHVAESGDEPLLLALSTDCPVVIAPDRVAAAKYLLSKHACDVIISDDGLQHYRLQRDFEMAVIDGARGLGNGHCLPVGPLRESSARLEQVDAVLVNISIESREQLREPHFAFHLRPRAFVSLRDGRELSPSQWPQARVHAVAGIGNPGRFFNTLRELGLEVIEHAFSDHHEFVANDLKFGDALPVVMTEKDAVKCVGLDSGLHELWYLSVDTTLPDSLIDLIVGRIAESKR